VSVPHLQNYMCNARVSECQSVLSNEPHYAVDCESVTICVLGRVLGAFTRSGRTNFAFIFLSRVGMPVDACERDCNYDRHVRLFVRLSVTGWYYIKKNALVVKLFAPPGRNMTL